MHTKVSVRVYSKMLTNMVGAAFHIIFAHVNFLQNELVLLTY